MEGTLNLRNVDLFNNDWIQIWDPLGAYGNIRFTIKANDSSAVEWTELSTSTISSGSQYRHYMPTNYINDLTLENGVEYIWRYTTTYAQDSNNSTENGFVPASLGTQKWTMQAYDGSSYEQVYYDMVSDPKPFVLTINNRYPAAGRKTMLEFSFMMDVSVTASDWM